MLNISPNRINDRVDPSEYASLRQTENKTSGKVLIRLLVILSAIGLILMFLPWTQNIRANGMVTTLKPDQRPQTVHTTIAGRIEKWYVQEGDFVEKGDTIMHISEIVDDYLDPDLLARVTEQVQSQQLATAAYRNKANALTTQIEALQRSGTLKLRQAERKLQQARLQVTSDSIDVEAARINFQIAEQQHLRITGLWEKGLKSKTEMENRELALQKARADLVSAQNRLETSRNEVSISEVALQAIEAEYGDAVAKALSEKFSAESKMYDTETNVARLENQLQSYSVRAGMYYITAPQDGYVTRAIRSGIGETIKAGVEIVSIMPADYQLAVQMYVAPIDLPLLEKGQSIRIQFDGWPAIVFSGWPNTSHGTYGGKVFAIDKFISTNGMYRVLVEPDPADHPWPSALRIGAGTDNIVLLKNVPVWYELWRKINGFPPDYYKNVPAETNTTASE